ncbi:unnamed protein product [Closterium sp. NIES-54]
MATPPVLALDADGLPYQFDFWLMCLPLHLRCYIRDGVSLLGQTSRSLPAPTTPTEPADEDVQRHLLLSSPPAHVFPTLPAAPLPRPRPPAVPGTHVMALCPSSVPQRVAQPSPPVSSLPDVRDHESKLARATSPTVTRLLAAVVTDPDFESTAAFALVTELVNFAARSRLDYAASLVTESQSVCPLSVGSELALGCDVLEDRQFEFECLPAALPRFAPMLLCPEGDLDAVDIPTPCSYVEAIMGEYSSQWQTAMDVEMAS